ncbi:hypothetical protein D3C72_1319350 [compost metagenome]
MVLVRSHAAGSDQLTNVLRGQEGTTARDWPSGTVIGNRWTAGDADSVIAGIRAVKPLSEGGTGVAASNTADVRAALGLGSAAVAPIVGTVSQSGGVPTGAIIQRGSNANGEFVRYADGTQECWKILTVNTAISNSDGGSLLYSAAIDVGLFPIQFSPNAPAVDMFALGGAGSFVTATSTPQTTTSWGQIYLASGLARAAVNHYISCHAKGRWF